MPDSSTRWVKWDAAEFQRRTVERTACGRWSKEMAVAVVVVVVRGLTLIVGHMGRVALGYPLVLGAAVVVAFTWRKGSRQTADEADRWVGGRVQMGRHQPTRAGDSRLESSNQRMIAALDEYAGYTVFVLEATSSRRGGPGSRRGDGLGWRRRRKRWWWWWLRGIESSLRY